MEFHRLLLTFLLAIYLFVTFSMAYLVVDRRFKGHYSNELSDQTLLIDSHSSSHSKRVKAKLSTPKEIQGLAVGIPTTLTYFLKNIHEEMMICDIQIEDLFSPSMMFETIHRKEIVLDEEELEELAAEDQDDEYWYEEDPDDGFEITKEMNVIRL